MSGEPVVVGVADHRSARGDAVLTTHGLGSCVAIALYDSSTAVGGLAHILLPSLSLNRGSDNPARFPQTALPAMLKDMTHLGADPRRLTARLVGGASMFANLAVAGSIQMGDRNIAAVRETLAKLAIPVTAELTGGRQGRSVWFHLADGRVIVRSVGADEQLL